MDILHFPDTISFFTYFRYLMINIRQKRFVPFRFEAYFAPFDKQTNHQVR